MRIQKLTLAFGLAGAALLLEWALGRVMPGHLPFLFFVPAAIAAAVFLDIWAAVLVLVLGAVHGFLSVRAEVPLLLHEQPGVWSGVAFTAIAVGLLFLAWRLHRSLRHANATERHLQQRVADLDELARLTARLEVLPELPERLKEIVVSLVRLVGGTCGTVLLRDEGTGELRWAAKAGLDEGLAERLLTVPPELGPCALAIRRCEPVSLLETQAATLPAALREVAFAGGFHSVHARPLLDRDGRALGALSVYLPQSRVLSRREEHLADICARKAARLLEHAQAEHQARETDRRFRRVLDHSGAGFTILRPLRDGDGIIHDFTWVYINAAAASVWRLPPETLTGRPVSETLPGAWQDAALLDAYVSVVRDGITHEFEHETRQTLEPQWFHIIASPLDGDVAVWFTNITARRLHEIALQAADQRKDEFLATLAHELRNPLAPIRQATQIAMTPQATEAQKHWSHSVIERQVQHMSLLLDDLLDISRITRGQLRLRRQPCSLTSIFGAAVEAARPLVDARRHELVVELPDETLWVEADPLRLAQILSNLLTNAAKYTNPGGHLRASARVDDAQLVIEVADDGIGLAPGELQTLFRMFSQVKSAQERSEGGLGIGLALTRGLVELHGGTITGHSAGPGLGSTFIARLPVLATPRAERDPGQGSSARLAPGSALPLRLLIADDNVDAAESLAVLMRLDGHEVRLAHDGHAALDLLRSFRPDAALLDIGMPGLSGYDVARAVRRDPELQCLLLIAVTGWGQAADKARALAEGFDVHMTKPVDTARLAEVLRERAATPAGEQA